MEVIYLNSFRIALPVAFPATRRPTRFPVGGVLFGRKRRQQNEASVKI